MKTNKLSLKSFHPLANPFFAILIFFSHIERRFYGFNMYSFILFSFLAVKKVIIKELSVSNKLLWQIFLIYLS
jgi:hypothetical protein